MRMPCRYSSFLFSALLVGFICNVYFVLFLWKDNQRYQDTLSTIPTVKSHVRFDNSGGLTFKKLQTTLNYSTILFKKSSEILLQLKQELSFSDNTSNILNKLSEWVTPSQLIPSHAPGLGNIIYYLQTAKVLRAVVPNGGTQLKILLLLEGEQKALLKPQWYNRTAIIKGNVYGGCDRHNGEIIAFYLSLLLDLRRTPIAVGRIFQLSSEIWNKAEPQLAATFEKDSYNNTCFYGICMYCRKERKVCAKGNLIEGAVILWLPSTVELTMYQSPWQRTYKQKVLAVWQTDDKYCSKLMNESETYNIKPGNRRLLDLIETSIFDFLINNGDRHHYETIRGSHDAAVLLLDNGKSFGRPDEDFLDILAPLYQCCVIRKSMYHRLEIVSEGPLSLMLRELTRVDSLYPLLTEEHLSAMDRRLKYVMKVIASCVETKGAELVFV